MFNYSLNFKDGALIEIDKNNLEGKYNVIFKDIDEDKIIYNDTIEPGQYAKTSQIYFKNWNIKVFYNNNLILDYNLNLNNKIVHIKFQSKSLGDTLAWIPYVEEFRKKHNCKIYLSTYINDLFIDQYPQIHFIKPNEIINDAFAIYNIGWFYPFENKNPIDYKKIPLQKTSSDILGLEFKEIKPLVTKRLNYKNNPINNKYVCISEFSTAGAKEWHYPIIDSNKGWQILIDWLNFNGYKVMVISKQKTNLKNIIDRTGDYPLDIRIYELLNCEFFISIGSGLSWLAWALNKKVVMISGFSDPFCEFKENNIRIINKNVCNSCFNKYFLDKNDWYWCPINKNTNKHFECTINITPEIIANKIIDNNLIESPKKNFSFDLKLDNVKLKSNEVEIYYKYDRINIHYKNNKIIKNVNINIRDDNYNIIKTWRDIELNNNFVIWFLPINKKSNKYYLEFFTYNKKLFNNILNI